MSKKNNMKQDFKELQEELDNLQTVEGRMRATLRILSCIKLTREKAIAVTKIEEAVMWLEKRQRQLSIEIAHITCK